MVVAVYHCGQCEQFRTAMFDLRFLREHARRHRKAPK